MITNIIKTVVVALFGVMVIFSAIPQKVLALQQIENRFYLVSLGVGDPDLITLRAINTIKASDVIVCRGRDKEGLSEHLKGKTILDPSKAGWRRYRKDCASIKDPEKRAECQKSAEARAQLINKKINGYSVNRELDLFSATGLIVASLFGK